MKIWKFPLEVTDTQCLSMPRAAQILDVQTQRGFPVLWALCDEFAPDEHRKITIYGTGNEMPDAHGKYIATFQSYDGELVFHAFDAGVV